jgi:hypothetical protein
MNKNKQIKWMDEWNWMNKNEYTNKWEWISEYKWMKFVYDGTSHNCSF